MKRPRRTIKRQHPSQTPEKLADGRRRSGEWRAREREAKKHKRWFAGAPNKAVSRYVWLLRSEIASVVAEMRLEPSDDEWLSRSELKKLEGKAIAAVVRWALAELKTKRR